MSVQTVVRRVAENLRIQRMHIGVASLPHQAHRPLLVFDKELHEALSAALAALLDRPMRLPIREAVDVVLLVEVADESEFLEAHQLSNDVEHILFPDSGQDFGVELEANVGGGTKQSAVHILHLLEALLDGIHLASGQRKPSCSRIALQINPVPLDLEEFLFT